MAEFIEVVKAKHRMCNNYSECKGCPLDNCDCSTPSNENAEEYERIVLKWAAEHPEPRIRTMKDVVLEKFPNAPLNAYGSLKSCVCSLFNVKIDDCAKTPCHKCWNRPAPDEYQDIIKENDNEA